MTVRFTGWGSATLCLFIVLTLLGCTLLTPIESVTTHAVLNKTPTTIPQGKKSQATLLVILPEATPPFDTALMAYTTQPYQIDYFSHHEWAAPPAQMLLPLLVRTLEETHHFQAVVSPPMPSHYDYVLRSELTEIIQDFTSINATMRLSLRIQLSSTATGRIIASRNIEKRTAISEKNPSAGAVAANDAVALALEEIAQFVLAASAQP